MNPLSATNLITAFVLCLCWGVSRAADNLYVFVFKDGAAQQNITVSVGDQKKTTNEFGLANFALAADDYDIGYYKNGELFALTSIKLIEDQQSQVFLELTRDGADVDLDLPLAAYNQNFEQQRIKEQLGPKGTLKLKVIDTKESKPIAGAKLFFKGYAVEAVSDENGIATVDLSEGRYDISVVHPKYVMQVLKDVSIKASKTQEQEAKLVRADIVMEEYVVSAPAVEGSLASTFTAMKDSSVIGDALSSEEFTKSGDSSAADALKRVTGITIVDGKYVYVRGLGERYSVVMLNDLFVPSPEPTKRVVPLDIIPSSVIQSMDIQKTYSADLQGSFAGGDVLIVSKDIPAEDNYIKLSVNSPANTATGKKVYSNADNSKGLPADIIQKSSNFQPLQLAYPSIGVPGYTAQELQAMNSAVANYRHYDLQTVTLQPGYKLALDIGQSFKTSGGLKYGVVGTVYTAADGTSKEATKYSTHYDMPTGVLSGGEKSDYQQTKLSEKAGGLLSFALDNRTGSKIKYTLLRLNSNVNATIYSQKDGGQQGPGTDDQERTYYEYKEKTITVHQLGGEHNLNLGFSRSDFFNDVRVKWAAEKAQATRSVPGAVEYVYQKTSNVTDYALDQKIWYTYSDLKDDLYNFRIDTTLPYKFNSHDNYTAFGIFYSSKKRTLDNRRLKVEHSLGNAVYDDIDSAFSQENIDNGDLVLTSNYLPADAYTATQNVTAFYLKQLLSLTRNVDVLAGIRQENSTQQLIDSESGVPYDPLVTSDVLASLSVSYSINDENKVRLGYANTLSRPDFREFSPSQYKDPVTEDIVIGYPGLTYTTINNLDLKYDWYISYDEVFSAGLFLKDFKNPVETVVNEDPNSQTGKKLISFRNALGATSKGFELSLRKRLTFLPGKSFSNYFVSSNFALIDSNIRLNNNSGDSMIDQLSTTNRPMQGQSPYVLNFNIGYDNIGAGRSVVLLYNEFGKRITALGSHGAPDYYEYPFIKLDFVVKWRLNNTHDAQVKKPAYNLDFKVTNILDSKVETRQGDVVAETYRPGIGANLAFSIKY